MRALQHPHTSSRPTLQLARASPQTTVLPQTSTFIKPQHAGTTAVQELRGTDITTINLRSAQSSSDQLAHAPRTAATPDYTTPTQEKALTFVRSLFLPDGYPASTTPDYLPYQLWATPTHVLGSLAHALTTSSLLQAVGVSAGPAATTAASAAIKWITKDGIGALGRFFVGGSLSQEFDRDPRRWRMVAELCTSAGAGLEIATAAFPQHFLLLAGAGHFAKALAKAMGKPVFRVIQTHFAADNNVGAVAAKEEVWEVVAQLTGYAVSLAVLSAVDAVIVERGGTSSGTELVAIWAAVQSMHILLRYQSLRSLVFTSLNDKRGLMLMSDHVAGRPLRNATQINGMEPMLPTHLCMEPRMHMGTLSVTEIFQAAAETEQGLKAGKGLGEVGGMPANSSEQPGLARFAGQERDGGGVASVGERLLQLYEKEEYVLVWRDGEALVLLRDTAGPIAPLRALWQASWLHHHCTKAASRASTTGAAAESEATPLLQESVVANGQASTGAGTGADSCMELSGFMLLAASLRELEARYGHFESEARAVGWDVSSILMGSGPVRFRTL